jgi:putative transposase
MAYSLDIRERVVGAVVEEGMSRRAAARRFKVSDSSAIKWVEHFEATGRVEPDARSETNRSVLNDERAFLLELVAVESDLTLEEIVERLAARSVEVCPSAVWRFFDRNDIRFKKKRSTPASRTGQTWQRPAKTGGMSSLRWTRHAWFSLTKRG